MGKHYITLVAALFSASVFAQTPFQKFIAEKANKSLINKEMALKGKKTNLRLTNIGLPKADKLKSFRKAASADTIITSQPAGTLYKNWYQYSEGYYIFWGYPMSGINDGNTQDFVITDDGTVYLKNPISNYATNSWIKGHKIEGDTIAFDFPQKIYTQEAEAGEEYADEDQTINISAWRMVYTIGEDEEGEYQTYVPDSTTQTVKFVFRNDSLFKTEPDILLAMGESTTGEWAGYGDLTNDISLVKDQPASPTTTNDDKYLIKSTDASGNDVYQVAKVVVENNDIYLGGINPNEENSWAKGRLEGNKAIFDKQQYLGVDNVTKAHTYFIPVDKKTITMDFGNGFVFDYDSVYAVKEIVFDYDAANKTLKSEGGFDINKGTITINQQAEYFTPSLALWEDKPGISEIPFIADYNPFDDATGRGGIQFVLSRLTDEGQYLNPDKLYYNIYFDDEAFTFYPDEYPEFTEAVTDVPYNHTGKDIQGFDDSRIVYFYTTGFEKIGVKEVYIDDNGKRYESETAWIDSDGNEIDGIKNASFKNLKGVKSVTYTDISGRKVASPAKGLYIKSTTLDDGTVRTAKVFVK